MPGFNDLGYSVTLIFLSGNKFCLQLHVSPRDRNVAAAMYVKLCLLNANLVFKEPHQLTKLGQLKQYFL